jgi:hypothetical protein
VGQVAPSLLTLGGAERLRAHSSGVMRLLVGELDAAILRSGKNLNLQIRPWNLRVYYSQAPGRTYKPRFRRKGRLAIPACIRPREVPVEAYSITRIRRPPPMFFSGSGPQCWDALLAYPRELQKIATFVSLIATRTFGRQNEAQTQIPLVG